jgi:hypothetical protein
LQLLPYYEHQGIYDNITNYAASNSTYAVWSSNAVVEGRINSLLCPSDDNWRRMRYIPTNYMLSWGDHIYDQYVVTGGGVNESGTRNPMRSMFVLKTWRDISYITDGTSNTIAMSESVICSNNSSHLLKGGIFPLISSPDNSNGGGPIGKCGLTVLTEPTNRTTYRSSLTYINPIASTDIVKNQRGGRFHDGRILYTGFTTVLPPNFPNCSHASNAENSFGIYSAQSYHPGGVNGLRFDSSVLFIPETIDFNGGAGGQVRSGPSPYGVWGALGSPNGDESITTP